MPDHMGQLQWETELADLRLEKQTKPTRVGVASRQSIDGSLRTAHVRQG